MKIAFIVASFPTMSETFILNQMTGLLQRGHQLNIFASRPSKYAVVHPEVGEYKLLERTYYRMSAPINKARRFKGAVKIVVKKFHKKPKTLLKALNFFKYGKGALGLWKLYAIKPFLDDDSYQIIHCHYGRLADLGIFLRDSAAVRAKLIVAFHGADISYHVEKHGNNLYNQAFEEADLLLPISERWRNKLIQLGCNEQKIIVHRVGINLDRFSFRSRRDSSDGKVRVLTIGRMVEKKGIEYGIRAIARLLVAYPHLQYTVVGEGPLKSNLEDLIIALKITDNVKLISGQDHNKIAVLMQNSDIFLAPSVTGQTGDQEGIPTTLMEAMACGLPVISTLHSGIPELVQDGKSGFLVPERDVEALAEKLEYLINHPECWPEMGFAGRQFVEANHDINKLNDRLVEIYAQLLETTSQ